jgi:integrase
VATDRGSVRWHRGGWEIRLQVDGRRITRRVAGANNRTGRRAAEDALDAMAVELAAGEDDLTVRRLLARYEAAASPDWSPSTRAAHPHHTRPVLEGIGDRPVAQLRRHDIEDLYGTWRAAGVKPGTIRRRHAVLAAALHHAEATGLILRSPAAHVRLPRREASIDDLQAHAEVLAGIGRLEHVRLKAVAQLALATGARRGELLALRWSDIDLAEGVVRIRAALATGPDGELVRKTTKGRQARVITIGRTAVVELKTWRAVARKQALALGVRLVDAHPVFPCPTDPRDPWAPDRVTRTWNRHQAAAGLALRFHDLRHRHATTLLEAGVPVHVVSARLGHASAKMTLDTYAHALPGGDRAAADVMDAARAR